jgi:hypothetical protein
LDRNGASWKIVDNYKVIAKSPVATKIAVDGRGHVVVIGSDAGTFEGLAPLMRRSENGGSSWKNISYASVPFVHRVVLGSNGGEVTVAGYSIPSRPDINGPKWVVYHSANGKTGWKVVDRFGLTEDLTNSSLPLGGAVTPSGRILLVGAANESSADSMHWVVREANVASISKWETLDNYRPLDFTLGFGEAWSYGATYTRLLQRIFVNGQQKRPGLEVSDALVREGIRGITNFTPTDQVTDSQVLAEGRDYVYLGGMVTMRNNQVLSGLNTPRRGQYAWLIRKMSCPL